MFGEKTKLVGFFCRSLHLGADSKRTAVKRGSLEEGSAIDHGGAVTVFEL